MTESLNRRGPDAQEVWSDGWAGFGHAMLRTTDEAENERQPCTLDGRTWITADARVDAREELIARLEAQGENPRKAVTDPELILHAYCAWGEELVTRLLGDFAFAILDGDRQKLFCARDHMGIKPFYYAETGEGLVFSNTLNCVRRHPLVSSDLNDVAIGDFLLFGYNRDTSATTFADIRQLPPASTLSFSRRGLAIRRYWQLPDPKELWYRDKLEYVDQFLELLNTATTDRLRSNRVAISLSGGLDSTAIAASASDTLRGRGSDDGLLAITAVWDRIIPDRERYFASLTGEKLRVPVKFVQGDDYRLFERWDSPRMRTPEPDYNPDLALVVDQFEIAAGFGRVLLDGYDGDALLVPSRGAYFRSLIRKHDLVRALSETAWYLATRRRVPSLGIRAALKRRRETKSPERSGYPVWLNPEFERRCNLRERWAAWFQVDVPEAFATRPETFSLLTSPFWPAIATGCDPGVTNCNVESRHPFMDIRLIGFCLSLPQIPWCVGKHIIRVSMCDKLPSEVLRRRKESLAGNTVAERLERDRSGFMSIFGDPPARLAKYVDLSLLPRSGVSEPIADSTHFMPLTLGWWMRSPLRLD